MAQAANAAAGGGVYQSVNKRCRRAAPRQRFLFDYRQPRYIKQYGVHLGDGLSFEQPLNLQRVAAIFGMT